MPVTVKAVMKVMEDFAPLNLAQDWDNCGLLVGHENREVNKLYIALDPTIEVIEEAIRCGANMLITHHPLLLHKVNKIDSSTAVGQKITMLIKNDLALYCAHTNLDVAIGGLNDFLAEKMGLKTHEVLEITGMCEGRPVGIGCTGFLETPTDLYALTQRVKKALNLEAISYVGDKAKWIEKIAVGCGSSMDSLKQAVAVKADVLITGDIKYHGAMEAKELGIGLIDATHFGTENIVTELLEKRFKKELPTLNLILDNQLHNPIQII